MNLKILLSTTLIASGFTVLAQNTATTYAITGDGNGDFNWMNIRQIDITSGKVIGNIYERNKTSYMMLDADTKQPVNNTIFFPSLNSTGAIANDNLPTASMVAALAYDKNQNKLFFAPMRIGELRWLDLNNKPGSQIFYSVKSSVLSAVDLNTDESNQITRMVINADGYGYALTNDANHLYRFTTGKKVIITDLGSIIDAATNKDISIHNKCTSWGGDMVADAYNKLYLITANHAVFNIDVDAKIATYIGSVTALPATFSTNGAAVDNDGAVVVSSANSFSGYYKFKLTDLAAVKIEGSDNVYNASDLANGNLLLQKEADAAKIYSITSVKTIVPAVNNAPHIYPNPVTNNEFKILFDGQNPGQYNISLTDLSGKTVLNQIVNLTIKNQIETVRINNMLAKGMYMVKVTDAANSFILTEKIVIE